MTRQIPIDISIKNKVEQFFSPFATSYFIKNQILISPDEDITSIYFLKQGLVRMYIISPEGGEATIHVFQVGSFFPLMLSLSNTPNKYYFEAMENITVVKAPSDKVSSFIQDNPDVLFNVTTRFASALSGLMDRIEQLVSHGAYSKIASLLLYLADTSVNKNKDRHMIDLQFNHEQIATWVGVARETVSRQLEKLENEGIITQKDHKIVINDLARLKDEVSK
jgi:CRP/FNR family transcriptional regulator